MKKNILKDSNSLLGFLISIKDENNNCDADKIYSVIGYKKSSDLMVLIDELIDKKSVTQADTCTIHILEHGIASYINPAKMLWLKTKKPISYVFAYIMGIISTVIAQLIINSITSNTP